MKTLLLIVTLLLVPSSALADYDARKSEAMSSLERAEMSVEERAAIKKALETYFPAREDCLEGLVTLIAKDDKSPLHATFRDRAGVCGVGAAQVIKNALAEIKEPSKGALEFINVFNNDEAAFYEKLKETLIGEARDLIVVIRFNLQDMTEVLDGKWKKILDEDQTLDERAKKYAEEIRSDYDTVIKEAAESHKDAAELIAQGVKQYAGSPTTPSPETGNTTIDGIITVVRGALVPAIELWEATNTRGETRKGSYRTLFTSERRVLVMFEDVREDVKKFLEDNDFPDAEAAHAKGKSSLDSFVSSAKTSALSTDASELRDDLMVQLTDHLKDAADVYAKFVGKHKEKFFGALGPNIKEDLVEHKAWDDFGDNVERFALDAKVRTWQDDATNYFGVDLSPLSSDHRERLKTGLRQIIENLIKELKDAGQTYRDVKTVIEDERDDVEEELN
jgi:hypothetical protein